MVAANQRCGKRRSPQRCSKPDPSFAYLIFVLFSIPSSPDCIGRVLKRIEQREQYRSYPGASDCGSGCINETEKGRGVTALRVGANPDTTQSAGQQFRISHQFSKEMEALFWREKNQRSVCSALSLHSFRAGFSASPAL